MVTQITATLPTLDFPREVDYPTQEDWVAFSVAAELNFGILGGDWSTQMQLWKTEANAMSTEFNTNATIAQGLADYQGDWTSQGYTLGQTVSIGGIYYICKLTHATGQNPTDVGSLYWNLALGNWNLKVNNYGNETIAGIKTFTSSPIVPTPTTNTQAANKQYVDSAYSGFKNYIINGKKVVNQRGLTSTDNSYNQDRWCKVGNNWFQGIEGDNNLISGKKYTLSWVGSAVAGYYVGNATSAIINLQIFTPIANGGSFTLTISPGQNLWVVFYSDATGSTFNFVQLEEGSVATPFENRHYGLELSLCQRYYEICDSAMQGFASAAGQIWGYRVPMAPKRVLATLATKTFSQANGVVSGPSNGNIDSFIFNITTSGVGAFSGTLQITASAEL